MGWKSKLYELISKKHYTKEETDELLIGRDNTSAMNTYGKGDFKVILTLEGSDKQYYFKTDDGEIVQSKDGVTEWYLPKQAILDQTNFTKKYVGGELFVLGESYGQFFISPDGNNLVVENLPEGVQFESLGNVFKWSESGNQWVSKPIYDLPNEIQIGLLVSKLIGEPQE